MKVENFYEVSEALRDRCYQLKGQKYLADKLDISVAFLSAVINGHKSPTEAILNEIGYEVRYAKKRCYGNA